MTKPKEKNVGGNGILYSYCLKKREGRVPRVPHLIAPMQVGNCTWFCFAFNMDFQPFSAHGQL